MACATLKRSLDFDPLHSQSHSSPKRRRCLPMTISPSTPPTKKTETKSVFSEATPKLSSEEIAAKISQEIKKMQRRKQLLHQGQGQCPSAPASPSSGPPSPFSIADSQSDSVQSTSGLTPQSKKDTPLFNYRQVALICERMMKEREDQLREQYDKVLTCKLAEQYEAFLKFNHDQIRKQFIQSPVSYVS